MVGCVSSSPPFTPCSILRTPRNFVVLQEIAKKLGDTHSSLSWSPPEREPVCLDDDDFDAAEDDVSSAPTVHSSTHAVQGSASAGSDQSTYDRGTKRARSETQDSNTDVQGADALLQLAAAASSARDIEMRHKQRRPAAPPSSIMTHDGMDALLSAAQASGSASQASGQHFRGRSGSDLPSPRTGIPSSAVSGNQHQSSWHTDAGSGLDSAYTAQSSTSSGPPASQPQAPRTAPPAPSSDHANDAAAPKFHLTPRTAATPAAHAGMAGSGHTQAPGCSAGLPAGKYKVVTNMDTLPAGMKASIQNVVAQQQHGYAPMQMYQGGGVQHPHGLDAGGQAQPPGAMYMHAQAPSRPPQQHPAYSSTYPQPSMHDLYMMHGGGGGGGYGMPQGMVSSQHAPAFHGLVYQQQQQPQHMLQQVAPGQYTQSPHLQSMSSVPAAYQQMGQLQHMGGFPMPSHQALAAHVQHAPMQHQ